MPPGVFRHNDQYKDFHERLFSDVKVYRALGSAAEKAIRFGEAVIEPREYQEEAWSAIGGVRAKGKDSALVHLATGLGKTTVAAVDMLSFAVDFYEHEGRMPKMMFAVHQTEILEQAALRFKEFAPSLSQGYFVGDEKDTDSLLTLATMQSLSRNLESLDSEEFDYIAYDEAHHAQAQTYRKVVRYFRPSFKLALTATPDRMDEEDIRELFGNEVYSKTLAEAMGEGLLVDVDYHIVFDEAVKRAMEEGFTPETLSEIRELLKNTTRNEEIAEQIKDQVEQIGLEEAKTIVFCDSISQANEMATLLDGKAYHSEAEDLEATLDGFRNGSQQIITTCDMFNEGVDVPDTRLVVFLRATGSRTIFEQQLGRGMRKHPGKNILSVLDFVGNIERLSHIKDLVDAITETRIREGNEIGVDDIQGGAIAIRSNHTKFDFDRIVVDLLEKIGAIQEKNQINPLNELSNAELVELALRLNSDGPLTTPDINKLSSEKKFLGPSVIVRRFGSIHAFHHECGFETPKLITRGMSDDEIIALAKTLKPEGALTTPELKALSKEGDFASVGTILKRFGSIPNFQKACGFEALDLRSMSNDDIVSLALNISEKSPLSPSDMADLSDNNKFPSAHMIRSRFGSIKEFHQACGFDYVRTQATYDTNDIIERALKLSPKEPLTTKRIHELSSQDKFVSYSTITKNFGSLAGFQEACGFIIEKPPSQLASDDLIRLALELSPDEPLATHQMRALSKEGKFVSPKLINKHFGSIVAFQRACGFQND